MQLDGVREKLSACANVGQLMHEMLRLPENIKMLVVCLLWRWWTWRNKLNAGEKVCSLDGLSTEINHWAVDSLALCRQPRTSQTEAQVHAWRRPEEDWAFSATHGTGGWGFAIRDHEGEVRGSGAGRLHHVASALQAETEAPSPRRQTGE